MGSSAILEHPSWPPKMVVYCSGFPVEQSITSPTFFSKESQESVAHWLQTPHFLLPGAHLCSSENLKLCLFQYKTSHVSRDFYHLFVFHRKNIHPSCPPKLFKDELILFQIRVSRALIHSFATQCFALHVQRIYYS